MAEFKTRNFTPLEVTNQLDVDGEIEFSLDGGERDISTYLNVEEIRRLIAHLRHVINE